MTDQKTESQKTAKGPDLEGLPADPTTAPFWRAAREHRLVVQRCTAAARTSSTRARSAWRVPP